MTWSSQSLSQAEPIVSQYLVSIERRAHLILHPPCVDEGMISETTKCTKVALPLLDCGAVVSYFDGEEFSL